MARVILDDALRARLDLSTATTEVCEPDGTTVAYVISVAQYRRLFGEWIKGQFSDAAAEQSWRDYQSNGGVATAAAWRLAEEGTRGNEGAA